MCPECAPDCLHMGKSRNVRYRTYRAKRDGNTDLLRRHCHRGPGRRHARSGLGRVRHRSHHAPSRRSAGILWAYTAKQIIISIVTVQASDRLAAMGIALTVVSDALRSVAVPSSR